VCVNECVYLCACVCACVHLCDMSVCEGRYAHLCKYKALLVYSLVCIWH